LAVKRALKRPRTGGDRGDRDDDDRESVDEGSPVAVWLADPTNATHRDAAAEGIWDVRNRWKLGIIQSRTLDGICNMVKGYMSAGRTVREILAALEDPVTPVNQSVDWTSLRSDEEVVAFLRMTNAKPIRLLIVLHRPPGAAPVSPIPTGLEVWFPVDKFEPPLEYDDPIKDSDVVVRNIAGVGRRRMPTKDHTFEERKYKLREWIVRQQELLRIVKQTHWEKCPNAPIINSDHEDFCYIRNLKRPKCNTGARIVKARAVIPAGRRATALNRAHGVGRIRSKVQGIAAAQFAYEQLNPAG